MSARLGLLFSDGSILVLPEGTGVDTAQKEAVEHDRGEPHRQTRIIRLEIKVAEILQVLLLMLLLCPGPVLWA